MSASREKKRRQGASPFEKASQAQQEQAAYKRKVRTYTAIGVVVVVLVAALLFWNTGIIQSKAIAATVGDTNYTVTDVSYAYQSVRNNAYYSYYLSGLSSYIPGDDDIMDEETGKTYREDFMESALDYLTNMTALYDAAIADGYSADDVADDVQQAIASAKSAASSSGYGYSAYLKAVYGWYMSPSAYKSILTRDLIANAYRQDHSDSLTYTDEELQAYYEEHPDDLDTFEYSYLYFTPEEVATEDEDGTDLGLTEEEIEAREAEALAAAKEKAEAALAALEGGADVADVITEHSPNNNGDHTVSVGSSISSSVYAEDLFDYEDGQTGLVENGTSGYYVIVLHSRTLVETPNADVRHILVTAETTTDEDGHNEEPTEEAWAAAKTKADEILAEYEAGEHTEDAFAALAEKYSEDRDADGNLNNDGLYSNISSTNTSYVAEFMDWIFGDEAHSPGDTGIIRHEGGTGGYNGYHIMYYVGDNSPAWKNSATNALKSTSLTEWEEELSSGYEAAFTDAADDLG